MQNSIPPSISLLQSEKSLTPGCIRLLRIQSTSKISTAQAGLLHAVKKFDTSGWCRECSFVFQKNISIIFNKLFKALRRSTHGIAFAEY
jgi:hypothetical protein